MNKNERCATQRRRGEKENEIDMNEDDNSLVTQKKRLIPDLN